MALKIFYSFFRDLFLLTLFSFFLLLCLEDFEPGFVFLWLDFDIFLKAILAFGLLSLILKVLLRFRNIIDT